MVFNSLYEMFEAVSLCNWKEWLFRFTDTFSIWLGVEEKGCNKCFTLQSVFVMWLLVCYFVHQWSAEFLFMSLLFALETAVCLEWTLLSEMPGTTIPTSRWRLFMCWAWWYWFCCFWTAFTAVVLLPLAKHGDDSASNPLNVLLVRNIFG